MSRGRRRGPSLRRSRRTPVPRTPRPAPRSTRQLRSAAVSLRSRLRSRLWPTRRLFEARHAQLQQELAGLRAAVDGLAARQDSIFALQAELTTRLRRTQALSARVYELMHGWPELLVAAREDPSYDLAYDDSAPLISIPIPTFHSPDTLCDRALASVRAQTYS